MHEIIDDRKDSPIDPSTSERITPGQVRAELDAAGYALANEHGFLPNQ